MKDSIQEDKSIQQREPDILKSCFIMENFLEKYVYIKKHDLKNKKSEDEKIDNDSLDSIEEDEEAKSTGLKQKSIGSSNVIYNSNIEQYEKRNSRVSTSKKLKNDKNEKKNLNNNNNKILNNFLTSARESRKLNGEEYYMGTTFPKKEIEDYDDNLYMDKHLNTSIEIDFHKKPSANKIMFKNEFSNNMKSNWYLSKDLKKSLKNQTETKKKRRCFGCKAFKIDTKACQCSIF